MGPGPEEDSPAHPVLLTKGFYLGKYEVTQEQFEKVLRVNASTFKGDDLPVEMVSWNDAVKFCDTLNKMNAHPGDGGFRFQPRLSGNMHAGRNHYSLFLWRVHRTGVSQLCGQWN